MDAGSSRGNVEVRNLTEADATAKAWALEAGISEAGVDWDGQALAVHVDRDIQVAPRAGIAPCLRAEVVGLEDFRARGEPLAEAIENRWREGCHVPGV